LFPDASYNISFLVQSVFEYFSAMALATYYFYYLVKELNIQKNRFFSTKFLLLSLVISFVLGFVVMYLVTGDLVLSKHIFIVFPIFIAIYFCFRTLLFIVKNKYKRKRHLFHHKLLTLSGYLGVIFMASMPIVVFFGDYQSIINGLVNISFVLSALAFYKSQLYQSRMEYATLEKIGYFSKNEIEEESPSILEPILDFELTPKEIEVAQLILGNLTYRQISKRLFIAERTASKHASNIFKKTESASKKDFISRFSQK
jgi:DNA-binding CsgD family transcriptional regulator/uncharacterized membrane protein